LFFDFQRAHNVISPGKTHFKAHRAAKYQSILPYHPLKNIAVLKAYKTEKITEKILCYPVWHE